MYRRFVKFALAASLSLSFVVGCGKPVSRESRLPYVPGPQLFVAAGDWRSPGALYTIPLGPDAETTVPRPIELFTISKDTELSRVENGIALLDGWYGVVSVHKVGATQLPRPFFRERGAFPKDYVAVGNGLGLVSVSGRRTLALVSETSGRGVGNVVIDTDPLVRRPDLPAHAAKMAVDGEEVLVFLQRLTKDLKPSNASFAVAVDKKTRAVSAPVPLALKNPITAWTPGTGGDWFVGALGEWFKLDGGVERLCRLPKLHSCGVVVDEKKLGGEVGDLVFLDDDRFVVVTTPGATKTNEVAVYRVSDGGKEAILLSALTYRYVKAAFDGKVLYISDREASAPAIRRFRGDTLAPLPTIPLPMQPGHLVPIR